MGRFIEWRITFYTIIVASVVLIIYVSIRLRKKPDYTHMKPGNCDKCIKEAKTGDIVGVSYGSLRGELIKVFTGSMWAHTGIVIRTHAGPYVLEAGRYSRSRRGVLTTPLNEWLDWNKGNTIAWRQYNGVPLQIPKMLKFLDAHRNAKEDMFVGNWLWSMWKSRYKNGYPQKKYYCSQFATHFLQELSIIKKHYDPSGYKPWELLYGQLPLCKGAKYGCPIVVEDPRLQI